MTSLLSTLRTSPTTSDPRKLAWSDSSQPSSSLVQPLSGDDTLKFILDYTTPPPLLLSNVPPFPKCISALYCHPHSANSLSQNPTSHPVTTCDDGHSNRPTIASPLSHSIPPMNPTSLALCAPQCHTFHILPQSGNHPPPPPLPVP